MCTGAARRRFARLIAFVAVTFFVSDLPANPYGGIAERNPFGLRPPPPPVAVTNEEPAAPPPNVKLTGISNLFAKRALLEITEQQPPARPGQPPVASGTINRPILAEGEAAFGIEVLAIDLEKNVVKIRNSGTESQLTFEVPKPGAGPVAAHAAPALPAPPQTAAMAQPTIISASESRGGITMLGGGGNFAGNSSGVSTYGATPVSAPAVPYGGRSTSSSSYGGGPGPMASFGGIPSRPVRTPQPTQPGNVDTSMQPILIEANRLAHQNAPPGLEFPPLPPTELTPQVETQLPPAPGAR